MLEVCSGPVPEHTVVPLSFFQHTRDLFKEAAVLPRKPVVVTETKQRHIESWDKKKGKKGLPSTHLHSVWYNPKRETLTVEFKKGGLYRYRNVKPEMFDALLSAPSHGSFFHHNIRTSVPYQRLV